MPGFCHVLFDKFFFTRDPLSCMQMNHGKLLIQALHIFHYSSDSLSMADKTINRL